MITTHRNRARTALLYTLLFTIMLTIGLAVSNGEEYAGEFAKTGMTQGLEK